MPIELIPNVIFRMANRQDASQIRDILGYYIECSFFNWRYQVMDLEYFENWITAHQRPERPFWVAELDRQIIGYSCLSDFRSADGYWPCAEDSVYVRSEYSHSGIGEKLMQLLIDSGRSAGLRAIIAAIDAENVISINFHQKFGFVERGRLNNIGWKNNSWRSAVFMQYDLQPNSADFQPEKTLGKAKTTKTRKNGLCAPPD